MKCRNKEKWPNTHTHSTVEESRRCWQGAVPVPAPPVVASPPVVVHHPPVKMISPRQKSFLRDLGVTFRHDWTYEQASDAITAALQAKKAGRQGNRMYQDPELQKRLDVLTKMIEMIPDGYYATAPEGDGGHIDFIRISRPNRGKYRGAVKIQTQHSDKWKEKLVLWPSGQWSVYQRSVIDMLFLVIADHKTCARRYAIELQACFHCNTQLTDDRSRHYLVGPICEDKYNLQWQIDQVDEINNGMSFEDLVARGLPTRVWQEQAVA